MNGVRIIDFRSTRMFPAGRGMSNLTFRRATMDQKIVSERHAQELVKMDKFDELLDYLRDMNPETWKWLLSGDFLTACVRKGVAALKVIDLLLQNGMTKRKVMICAASNCCVDLLDAVCERGWHVDIPDVYLDMIVALGKKGTICNNRDPHSSASVALAFAEWLHDEAPSRWFSNCFDDDGWGEWILDGGREVTDERWIWCSEYALVNEAFEFCEGLFCRQYSRMCGMVYLSAIRFAARKGAVKTLDYLLEANLKSIDSNLDPWWADEPRFLDPPEECGDKRLFMEVRCELDTDDYSLEPPATWITWDECNRLKVELWLLKKRGASPARDHMKRAMERLDVVKERLPDNDYLVIANELGKAYRFVS